MSNFKNSYHLSQSNITKHRKIIAIMRNFIFSLVMLVAFFSSTHLHAQSDRSADTAQVANPDPVSRIHLHNGESIEGKIIGVGQETITIESSKGYGVLVIPKTDILLISFPQSEINLNRRYGVGYLTKTNIINVFQNTLNFNLNQFSFRTFLNDSTLFQYLIGYGDMNVKSQDPSASAGDPQFIYTRYTIFTASLRAAFVTSRQLNSLTYWGISGGVVQLRDDAQEINESGLMASAFFGAEMFFSILPNFGFSGEISFDYQSTESVTRTEINVGPIPIFSVHYYF